MPDLALKLKNPLAMFAPAYPEANIETKYKSPLVPLPTNAFIPQRDLDKTPVLEVSHLGIDFGGLTAVDDFNLTIGRTEMAFFDPTQNPPAILRPGDQLRFRIERIIR